MRKHGDQMKELMAAMKQSSSALETYRTELTQVCTQWHKPCQLYGVLHCVYIPCICRQVRCCDIKYVSAMYRSGMRY